MPQVDFPDSGNLLFGNGAIYAADLSGTYVGGEAFMGNCTQFGLTVGGTKVTKRSRVSASRGIFFQTTVSKEITVSITADEYTLKNLQMHTQSTQAADTQGSGTLVDFDIPEAAWKYDLWYDLGYRTLSSVTVENVVTAVDTMLVLNTDYELDAAAGRIRILSTGDAVEGELLKINGAYAAIAKQKLYIAMAPDAVRMIRFIGDPTAGPAYDVILHRVFVSPNGETSLIQESDDPGVMVFTGTVADDSDNNPTNPFGVIYEK